ncbi:MAG: ATP-dependent DNA helicase, partial [Clostridium fessum]
IGKTLSTVFPALKAIGEGHGQKLFYLTAKTITRTVAEEALAILRERGLYFRSVTITAKEKLCILEKPVCNPEMCPRAKGHFDRVNDAVYEILHQEFGITRSVILEYAEKFQVCPFEFCLDISSFVDGIICDYNYVFDPDVRLKRYFADGAEGDYFFLMDEAHNLVSRARKCIVLLL